MITPIIAFFLIYLGFKIGQLHEKRKNLDKLRNMPSCKCDMEPWMKWSQDIKDSSTEKQIN